MISAPEKTSGKMHHAKPMFNLPKKIREKYTTRNPCSTYRKKFGKNTPRETHVQPTEKKRNPLAHMFHQDVERLSVVTKL